MQIPDIRTDDDVIDAVVVDEEAVGGEGRGRGAKILYGKGALDQYLSEQKNDSEVCIRICDTWIFFLLLSNQFLIMLLFVLIDHGGISCR